MEFYRMKAGAFAVVMLTFSPASAQSLPSKPGTVFHDCKGCADMVVIPAGSFQMGASEAETAREGLTPEAGSRERPVHKVTIAKPFALGKFEVTRAQYAAFAKATKRPDGAVCLTWDQKKNDWLDVQGATWHDPGFPQTDKDPVACVSLDDAEAYAAWLSTKTGKHYRIPSEAEWEYAARAGTATARYWGDDATAACAHANVSDLTAAETHPALKTQDGRLLPCTDGYVYTAPVGKFDANAFGLYDMIGNVWEWVEDCYSETYTGAPTDGSAWITPNCERRTVKGGGWYARNWFTRAAARSREVKDAHMATLGFRLARDLDPG